MPITIKGTQYPIKPTMWALLQFKRERGLLVSEMKANDIEEMLFYTWLCVKGACLQAGRTFDLSFDDHLTYVEGDPTEALMEEKLDDIKKKMESR